VPAITENLHATAIAVAGRGVLLRGPSGTGKSDLALRCLTLAAQPLLPGPVTLIADDRVVACREGARVMLSAPAALSGLIEVRGIGPVRIAPITEAALALAIDIVAAGAVERLPEPASVTICGVEVPLVRLDAREPSAPVKVLIAAARLGAPG